MPLLKSSHLLKEIVLASTCYLLLCFLTWQKVMICAIASKGCKVNRRTMLYLRRKKVWQVNQRRCSQVESWQRIQSWKSQSLWLPWQRRTSISYTRSVSVLSTQRVCGPQIFCCRSSFTCRSLLTRNLWQILTRYSSCAGLILRPQLMTITSISNSSRTASSSTLCWSAIPHSNSQTMFLIKLIRKVNYKS